MATFRKFNAANNNFTAFVINRDHVICAHGPNGSFPDNDDGTSKIMTSCGVEYHVRATLKEVTAWLNGEVNPAAA